MLATHWEPRSFWSDMTRLRDEMDRVVVDNGRRLGHSVYPPLNFWEDGNILIAEAELPGFDLNSLEITVTGGNQLSIKGQRKPPELEGGTWHRQERGFGRFARMIELPEHVNADKVSAEFSNGVLTITMVKTEAAKPRRIDVKAK